MGVPQTPSLTELRHSWGFVVGDIHDGQFSRDTIILAMGQGVLTAGLVLGIQSAGVAVAGPLGAANAGNPTFGPITVGAPAQPGQFALQFVDATHFTLEGGPQGEELGHGQLGTAFSAGGLSFTLTAGTSASVAGDSYTVTVGPGTGLYVPYNPTAADGSEFACAILGSGARDTTLANRKAGALVRGPSKVQAAELIWGVGVTTLAQQATALAQLKSIGILSV